MGLVNWARNYEDKASVLYDKNTLEAESEDGYRTK